MPVEGDYRFETTVGIKSLADLFDGYSQLLIYRQYGWSVEWFELGRRGSRRIQLLERVPQEDPNHT